MKTHHLVGKKVRFLVTVLLQLALVILCTSKIIQHVSHNSKLNLVVCEVSLSNLSPQMFKKLQMLAKWLRGKVLFISNLTKLYLAGFF